MTAGNDQSGSDETTTNRPDVLGDEVFSAMDHRHRRYALYVLLEYDSVSLSELANVVASWIHATEYGMVERDERDRVLTMLAHQHLPSMEAANLLTFDRNGDGRIVCETWPQAVLEFVQLSHDAETTHAG